VCTTFFKLKMLNLKFSFQETLISLYRRNTKSNKSGSTSQIMNAIRARPIKKSDVIGIHGTIFYELERKKQYYPERIDSLARNPTGSN
jgi:hypothetical protein